MKNKKLVIIVVILAALFAVFQMKDRFSTIKPELKDFAVKDTASITKIFLADRSGRQITLERKSKGVWRVNKDYIAKPYQVRSLMDVIYLVDVRTPVSKHGYNSVVKQLASNSIKCEIYTNDQDKPEKVYYVGGSTEDILGTFMMIEGSSAPFITEIRGFNGYLTPRYSVQLSDWKETAVLQYPVESISSFSVSYRNFPQNSFIISNENGAFNVSDFSSGSKGQTVPSDPIAVKNYLDLFPSVNVETWINKMSQGKKDSITADPPMVTLEIKLNDGNSRQILLYPMPLTDKSLTKTDENGNPLKYDLDKMYGLIQPGDQWASVQHFNFDRLLRRLTDFDSRNKKSSGTISPAL